MLEIVFTRLGKCPGIRSGYFSQDLAKYCWWFWPLFVAISKKPVTVGFVCAIKSRDSDLSLTMNLCDMALGALSADCRMKREASVNISTLLYQNGVSDDTGPRSHASECKVSVANIIVCTVLWRATQHCFALHYFQTSRGDAFTTGWADCCKFILG